MATWLLLALKEKSHNLYRPTFDDPSVESVGKEVLTGPTTVCFRLYPTLCCFLSTSNTRSLNNLQLLPVIGNKNYHWFKVNTLANKLVACCPRLWSPDKIQWMVRPGSANGKVGPESQCYLRIGGCFCVRGFCQDPPTNVANCKDIRYFFIFGRSTRPQIGQESATVDNRFAGLLDLHKNLHIKLT